MRDCKTLKPCAGLGDHRWGLGERLARKRIAWDWGRLLDAVDGDGE